MQLCFRLDDIPIEKDECQQDQANVRKNINLESNCTNSTVVEWYYTPVGVFIKKARLDRLEVFDVEME